MLDALLPLVRALARQTAAELFHASIDHETSSKKEPGHEQVREPRRHR